MIYLAVPGGRHSGEGRGVTFHCQKSTSPVIPSLLRNLSPPHYIQSPRPLPVHEQAAIWTVDLAIRTQAQQLTMGRGAADDRRCLSRAIHRTDTSNMARPDVDTATEPDHAATGLPLPLTPLVGRQHEVEELVGLLSGLDVRLVTLTGPGGVGKTRLAVRVASEVASSFADGVHFVPVATIRDPQLVLPAIATAVGLIGIDNRPMLTRLQERFRQRQMLLLVDNLEQVIDAAVSLVDLLTACPGLTVLATSREALRVRGEREYQVQPLAVPVVTVTDQMDAAAVQQIDAVDLFLQRARAIRPDFAITPANAATIAEICRQLDGLPLALELGAAWVKVLSPPALLTRLSHRLEVLTGGQRDQPARLRTMREAISWSHDLLPPEEQIVLRRLAVFAGSFTLEAAEVICDPPVAASSGEPSLPRPLSVLDSVSALIDKSLLRQIGEQDGGNQRFGMLETVREFAQERLVASGEIAPTRASHGAYFLALAEVAEADYLGAGEPVWLTRLALEHDNLRAALAWAADQPDPELLARLATALWRFWRVRGHIREGLDWLDRAIAHAADLPGSLHVAVLFALGTLTIPLGDYPRSERLGNEALVRARVIGDRRGAALALMVLGVNAKDQGDDDGARSHLSACLELCRELGDRQWLPVALNHLGLVTYRDDPDRAREMSEEALGLQRASGDRWSAAVSLQNLAAMAVDRDDLPSAAAHYQEGLAIWSDFADPWGLAHCLAGLAAIAAATGEPDRAARVLGAVDALRTAIGAAHRLRDKGPFDRAVSTTRARLGDDAFSAQWSAGLLLSPERAVEEAAAIGGHGPGPGTPRSESQPGRRVIPTVGPHLTLSGREQQVVELLAAGQSTAEIAAALYISPRTVTVHIGNILAKLEVDTRAAAIARAFQLGLV